MISLRAASMNDRPVISSLIATSARTLGALDYTEAEIEAALKGIWGLDTQLIEDRTYFLAFVDGELAGCGGWSYRNTLFGSDHREARDASKLDPDTDAARIRAFFTLPDFSRRGVGSALLERCEWEARRTGFRKLVLGATKPGQRLYQARGYVAQPSICCDLGGGMKMEVVPMTKKLIGQADSK